MIYQYKSKVISTPQIRTSENPISIFYIILYCRLTNTSPLPPLHYTVSQVRRWSIKDTILHIMSDSNSLNWKPLWLSLKVMDHVLFMDGKWPTFMTKIASVGKCIGQQQQINLFSYGRLEINMDILGNVFRPRKMRNSW